MPGGDGRVDARGPDELRPREEGREKRERSFENFPHGSSPFSKPGGRGPAVSSLEKLPPRATDRGEAHAQPFGFELDFPGFEHSAVETQHALARDAFGRRRE